MGEKIVENITDLLLEIIGYITPSVYLLGVLYFFTTDEFSYSLPALFNNELLLLILLYATGYLIRTVSIQIAYLKWFNLKKSVVKELKKTEIFREVKRSIQEDLDIDKDLDFNSIRSLCLGKYPAVSNKVYLFMFRSSLFFDLFIINSFVIIAIIIDCFIGSELFLHSTIHYVGYGALVLLSVPLLNSRKRFFKISYSIPINNFLSKKLT